MMNSLLNLKEQDYETICSVLNRKRYSNSILSFIDSIRYKYFDLILEDYYLMTFDYIIIGSNPILSNMVAIYLKENDIKNVLVHNLFLEDDYNYSKSRKHMIHFLDKIKEKYINERLFFRKINNKNYKYTIDKTIALSSFGKKINNEWIFTFVDHCNKNNCCSSEYINVWNNYFSGMNDLQNIISIIKNKSNLFGKKYYFVKSKKIIILMENNHYLPPNMINDNNSVFYFNKNNKDDFFNKLKSFVNTGLDVEDGLAI